ncbi:MAG: glycosyltransferase family 39 protein [Gammaproteobacteria bacterium]|nr:glycosyltransferase family 39 protein [Gammaproteobacteria bacterium]
MSPRNTGFRSFRHEGWLLLFVVVWFAMLGYRDLAEPDEGRYAEIPREMVASGDWVTPRLNDFKYFEKPVLQYWATAATFLAFGESNLTARLPVAVAGFLGALWIFYVGNRLWGREAGICAFLVLLSSTLYTVLGHFITLDMMLSVFLAVGVGALLLAQSERSDPLGVRNWMLLGWAVLGLATLTKGLVALVLPGGAILLYTLWQRDWALWRHLHLGKGILLLLLISAPWFVAVSLANPEFPQFFFIHEHFDRYTSEVHKRNQAMWYYLPILLAGLLPWLGTGFRALFSAGNHWRPDSPNHFDAVRFLWSLVLFTLVFFSLGRSMLPPYILPLFPALALIMGRRLALGVSVVADLAILFGMGVFCLVFSGINELFVSPKLPLAYLEAYGYWAMAAAVVFMTGGWLTWRFYGTRGWRAVAGISLTALLGVQLLTWGYQELGAARTSRALADVVRPLADEGARVFGANFYPQSLPFYLGQTIQLAMTTSELDMGIRMEPGKLIPSWDEFAKQWQQEEQAVSVFERKDFQRLGGDRIPGRVIYQDPRKLAVARR